MFSNCSQKLLCHSREGGNLGRITISVLIFLDSRFRGNDTILLGFVLLLLLLPLNSSAEQIRTLSSMKLSECGQAVKDFKKFLREARHCQSDNDCVVMEGMCPLGCKFFVHKIFQKIVEKRMVEFGGVCNSVCSVECPEEEVEVECNRKKCEKVK